MELESLGWTAFFAEALKAFDAEGVLAGRIAAGHARLYDVLTAEGTLLAGVSGRFRHRTGGPADFPATGDWVALVRCREPGRATICGLLPRRSALVRKSAGSSSVLRVVAANVDTVFLVAGLDRDLNPRRIERGLALARESGADPVVLLNKADLCPDVEASRRAVQAVAPGVPVEVVSALRGEGLYALAQHLRPGRTGVLLGSSGVGKSTLVNRLLGEHRQRTRAVRAEDDRGRHATAARELIPLPGGGLLIDTPGLREFSLQTGAQALAGGFPELSRLVEECRFADCRHEHEPGCAVLAAAEAGRLDPERLRSYRRLEAERRHLETRHDEAARRAQKARWKSVHKLARRHRPRE